MLSTAQGNTKKENEFLNVQNVSIWFLVQNAVQEK